MSIKKTKRLLSLRERVALQWVRSHFRAWRQRFSGSYRDHMAKRPRGYTECGWRTLYYRPMAGYWMAGNCLIVRRLLRTAGTWREKEE